MLYVLQTTSGINFLIQNDLFYCHSQSCNWIGQKSSLTTNYIVRLWRVFVFTESFPISNLINDISQILLQIGEKMTNWHFLLFFASNSKRLHKKLILFTTLYRYKLGAFAVFSGGKLYCYQIDILFVVLFFALLFLSLSVS